jgi:hypothetical protein
LGNKNAIIAVQRTLNHPQAGYLHFKRFTFEVFDVSDLKVILYTPLNEAETPAELALFARDIANGRKVWPLRPSFLPFFALCQKVWFSRSLRV